MERSKKTLLRSSADAKLIRTNWILRVLIIALGIIVIYDYYIHLTPLYYILFYSEA